METLYPASFMSSSRGFLQVNQTADWTKEENKRFESALAIFDENTPDRWRKVAAMIPGKTVWDVINHYNELVDDVSEIEAGRVPIPGYLASSFTFDITDGRDYDGSRKKGSIARGSDQERRKGVPWTEEEHKLFLMGLMQYGKGDWRNISRNFVVSKTPTQVASHAQKYFIRQLSGGKDKRRPSIHDITTISLAETTPFESRKPPIGDQSPMFSNQQKPTCTSKALLDWNEYGDGGLMVFDPTHRNLFLSSSCELTSSGIGQAQNLHGSTQYGTSIRPHSSIFQIRG